MKISLRRLALAACFALGYAGYAGAQSGFSDSSCTAGFCQAPACDAACDADCGSCCESCCDTCKEPGWGGYAEAELLFLRYHRADSVRIGADPGETGAFGFEPAGRYTAGIVAPNGIGMRLRYFRYDRSEGIEDVAAGDGVSVDTYNVDSEFFDTIVLSDVWAAEVSAGVRYNEFRETMRDIGELDFRSNNYRGAGLVAGLEGRRLLGSGHLYARVRGAVVQGNSSLVNIDGGVLNQNVFLDDTTHQVTEIAWGYETNYQLDNGATLFARSGVEWQNWANFSSAFDFVNGEGFFDGSSDVGFAGFTISGGVAY